jgi:hypothetical protein
MQFKYPELLWALLLLLIPILVHLFQLRRYKKTPFTNVKFLKKVASQSRRSNTLKKWLLLLTRMALITALVFAFAQPFFAEKSALKQKELVIYLDDSFSMQAKAEGNTLLENAVQGLIRSASNVEVFSIFTNEKVYEKTDMTDIKNDLLGLGYTIKPLTLKEITLKGKSYFSASTDNEKHFIIISDFQGNLGTIPLDSTDQIQYHLVRQRPDENRNISIDSLFVSDETSDNIEISTMLSSNGQSENTPVSLYDGERLIAKTAAIFDTDGKARVKFTLPLNEAIDGKLEILDNDLVYDNHFYFNLNKRDKIKVLSIGDANDDFLRRIFTEDEFQFSSSAIKSLNYADIPNQNLIILNELVTIPNPLITNLKSFTENGGNLAVIPSKDLDYNSYNMLMANYFATVVQEKVRSDQNITGISFSHPLYKNVFEGKVVNFQFPKLKEYYGINTNAPVLLSFQDNAPFLTGNDGIFLFTAPLNEENTNFKNSPLIVPTFYQMGLNSLKMQRLYSILGRPEKLDIPVVLAKDHILKLKKGAYEFIPQQQSLANMVTLSFDQGLIEDGIYGIMEDDMELEKISFNYDRRESRLDYLNLEQLKNASRDTSVDALFETMEKDNRITELWKWFVILALLLLAVEMIIQKIFK